MERETQLHQAVYHFFCAQIRFGFYRHGDSLPAMEEICRRFRISMDTVRPVYHRLRQDGFITLSQKSGARIAVRFGPEQTEQHVQAYFARHREVLLDLSRSMWPLFGRAQYLSLKYTPAATPGDAKTALPEPTNLPDRVWYYLEQQYSALGNSLLLRLLRYIFFFFQGPFYSVPGNQTYADLLPEWQQDLAEHLRRGDWDGLAGALRNSQKERVQALCRFYSKNIAQSASAETYQFRWDAYKKSSQRRYSLAIELLTDISEGIYPAGCYLPPAERIAQEKGVSVSTVRRTLSLLNSIGAVQSSRPLGARVLPPAQSTENCDFTQPDIRRRLVDLTESLQIFALSCRAVTEQTLAVLDAETLDLWKCSLSGLQNGRRSELAAYHSLELLSTYAPGQAVRTIYSELLRLLFWGNPLRGMRGESEKVNRYFDPYVKRMCSALETRSFCEYAGILEELLLRELRVTVKDLKQLGINGISAIRIPSAEEIS